MHTTKLVTYTLLAAAVLILVVSLLLTYKNQELRLSLENKLIEQERVLTALAELTNQYRADEVTESIIRDCSPENRKRFEELLNRLADLNKTELLEIEPLFDACASFFAERKALSVSRLQEEFNEFSSYIELYSLVAPSADVFDYNFSEWEKLVLREHDRRDALNELVAIQKKIIFELKNVPRDNGAIEAQVVRAKQVQERTAILNAQVNDLRSSVIKL